MIGKIFGDLTVTGFGGSVKYRRMWECKCRCGKTKTILEQNLKNGSSTSCGKCYYLQEHPDAYRSWQHMHTRCTNKNYAGHENYGGRGIKVCVRWAGFVNFLEDMGDPPYNSKTGERYSLDRINNDGDYTPENCRWADRHTQNNNRRDNKLTFQSS